MWEEDLRNILLGCFIQATFKVTSIIWKRCHKIKEFLGGFKVFMECWKKLALYGWMSAFLKFWIKCRQQIVVGVFVRLQWLTVQSRMLEPGNILQRILILSCCVNLRLSDILKCDQGRGRGPVVRMEGWQQCVVTRPRGFIVRDPDLVSFFTTVCWDDFGSVWSSFANLGFLIFVSFTFLGTTESVLNVKVSDLGSFIFGSDRSSRNANLRSSVCLSVRSELV